MQDSNVPTKFPIPWGQSAGGSYIRNIPQASQIGIQNGAASLTDGFPPLCFIPVSAGGTPPFGQDMNGILKQITQWNQWQQAGGPIKYDSAFQTSIGGYPKNAIIASAVTDGLFFISSTDNNVTNPDTGGAGWAPSSNIVSLSTSGYIKFAGGSILQWVHYTAAFPGSSTGVPTGMFWALQTITWPIAFPTACVGIYGSGDSILNNYLTQVAGVASAMATSGPIYTTSTQNVTNVPATVFGLGY